MKTRCVFDDGEDDYFDQLKSENEKLSERVSKLREALEDALLEFNTDDKPYYELQEALAQDDEMAAK